MYVGPLWVRSDAVPPTRVLVTRGGVVSVVSTVRFTQFSVTKSLGLGSAVPPRPVTPGTGSEDVMAKLAGQPRVNAWAWAVRSYSARNCVMWTGFEGTADGAAV